MNEVVDVALLRVVSWVFSLLGSFNNGNVIQLNSPQRPGGVLGLIFAG